MKRLIIGLLLVVILLVSLGGVVSCGKVGITGTYVNQDNPDDYLELEADGTYYLYEDGIGLTGEWETSGNELRLELWGFVVTGEIRGNDIIDPNGQVWVKQSKPSKEETLAPSEPTTPAATLEVANLNLSELIELREAIEQFITSARLIANEEETRLLSQANVVLAAIQSNSNLHNIVAEKTEERQLVLDILGGIFRVGVQRFYNIPSPVAWAITKGAEELGNRIAEWQVLGCLSLATVTQPDSGVMEVVYHKEQGEIWANFNIYDPVGRVCMYIRVEPALVSFEGGGNILLSEGVKPVTGKCRIAYHFGEVSLPTPAMADQGVIFPDSNLEAAIREAIDKPEGPIYASELEGLSPLDASGRNITDLTGLEYCTNLTKLDLCYNQISDISLLASLPSLRSLNLGGNSISGITPLASLTNLTSLRLDDNQISDISLLASFTNLTILWLDHNRISDISPLASLTELTLLYLNENQISDISPLASLTNLFDLRLRQNQISDISPLASLTSLLVLNLSENQISDISPLISLTNLAALTLGGNPLNNMSVNVYIPKLEQRGVDVYW